jgi:dTDP-4-amino-4,6-dideoxy-D-galactose acyltransferase
MTEAPATFLDWDSQFFGKRIARVNGNLLTPTTITILRAWCSEQRIECVYFLADSADALTIRTAEGAGFRLQDVRLTFMIHRPAVLPTSLPAEDAVTLRVSRPTDIDALRDTARHAYIHSRFYNDPRFTEEQCATLYDTWLTRSIDPNDHYADMTFVADLETAPVGYVACHLNPQTQTGTIGLVGVAEQTRGQQVGQKLVLHALRWFWDQGMQHIQVTTQGRNIAGQRLYQRCGFLTHSLFLWYHLWLDELP